MLSYSCLLAFQHHTLKKADCCLLAHHCRGLLASSGAFDLGATMISGGLTLPWERAVPARSCPFSSVPGLNGTEVFLF